MNTRVNCCGVICASCEHFPLVCQGCSQIEGKPFWLEFTKKRFAAFINVALQKKA